jgi:NTE family protein
MLLRNLLIYFSFSIIAIHANAQKVALVMSGGGAKGIAHIGVLKALEENDIPIDYVVGTSMGGIVAGCYAAGFSALQIEEIILSPKFNKWVNGEFEEGYNYYLYKDNNNSSFLSLNISLDSIFNASFNSSLASDITLNFALPEYLSQASAAANNNFDSLFVPLRIMAAEIFTQKEVILKDASLPLAVRTTLSVPFFYKPIKINDQYLFDGGIYNNFPVDVALKTFSPDVVIGSNVSSIVYNKYPYEDDDKLVNNSLLFMLINKADPEIIPKNGIYLEPNLSEYSALDFSKAKALIDSGYNATISQIEEIKTKIVDRETAFERSKKRSEFIDRGQPLNFSSINYHGYNSRQRKYIDHVFKMKNGELKSLEEIKRGYFKLVSEKYFNSVYPDISFNKSTNNFTLELYGRPRNNFTGEIGGTIATRNISQIYLGAEYSYFDNYLLKTSMNFYAGSFYKSAQFSSRLYLAIKIPFYIEPELTYNNWNYISSDDVFLSDEKPTVLDRTDRKYALNIGLPIRNRMKAVISGSFINNSDNFGNNSTFTSGDTLDILDLKGYRIGISVGRNNFNRKQYPSEGKGLNFSCDFFETDEIYEPGTTSITPALKDTQNWFRVSVKWEQYFKKGKWSTGYVFDGVFSNQGLFANYTGTLINLPSFNPLQDSRTLLLENFRAFSFASFGLRNILSIRQNLDFRFEGHLFKPFEILTFKNSLLEKEVNFDNLYFVASTALVAHSPVGPISVSLNYYDDAESKWGVLFHVGFLLFNNTSMGR